MFYTKYRPQIFSQISKPNDVAEALANQIKSGKTGHAYLFVGPRGTGKTTAARILAKALNCENISKSGDPCDECKVCSSIKLGSFMDLIEIDAASNRGIDDIRELKDKIKLAPSSGGKKIYIVDEVHMLTTEAFNALLKTLEEPPAHAVFVLCTTEDHKIPETIKSRCQIFKFKRATTNQIVEKLKHICKKENVKMKDEDLLKIANASAGGFRDAENLLQQIIEGELDVDSFVGVSSKQIYIDFVKSINLKTSPYPGFPTDLQAQLMVLLCMSKKISTISEEIFENRFMHVAELNRMGAKIKTKGNKAFIDGNTKFKSAELMATDLRASVSLILAALIAKGKTTINRIYHLDRGYEEIEKKLRKIGAKIRRVS